MGAFAAPLEKFRKEGKVMTLILLIVLAVILFGGGGGYYWHSRNRG